MKTARKRAIWYAYQEKQTRGQIEVLERYNLYDDYKHSKYKTMTGYLKNAYKEGKISNWREVYGNK